MSLSNGALSASFSPTSVVAGGSAGAGTTAATTVASTSAPSSTSMSTSGYRRWEPLPKILYGFSVSPFNPEIESLDLPHAQLDDATASALAIVQSHLIGLEVGDEVYVFEQLGHANVSWFRGYVVSTNRSPTSAMTTSSLSDYATFPASSVGAAAGASIIEEPQVYVGIFPASHVHIREQLDDAEMRLADIFEKAKEAGIVGATAPPPRSTLKAHMETLPEEEEEQSSRPTTPAGNLSAANASKVTFDGQRQSFVLADGGDSGRPPPPLPSLKCGDETLSGSTEPLVDEIACALREWSSLMYSYLGRRDYALFHVVRHHIEALHAARRQLLAQTLSAGEVTKLRRECVARLVKGNVAQGLDVIVRHPGRGGLVDVDFTGKDSDPESWVSGIRLYALQVALAYIDQEADDGRPSALEDSLNSFGASSLSPSGSGLTGPTAPFTGSNGRSKWARQASVSLSRNAAVTTLPEKLHVTPAVKYFHVFLDVRAFVASPCSPGETAELYFALYNRAEARFLTEEYCVVLNHHGVPARESENGLGKMRTLFSDLSANDMHDLNIVCRIVRNGGMRLSNQDQQRLSSGDAELDPYDQPDGPLTDSPGFRGSRMTTDRTFRRPFGCSVLELGSHHQFQPDLTSSSTLREHSMPIFVPVNEAAFSTLHQDIIASRIKEFEKSPRAEMVAVNVRVLHGETTTLIRENPSLLQDIPLTARLGFPDVVFPGDQRNEAYIKLWSGEFFPMGNKMAGGGPKNIQVSAEVRTRDGRVVERVISRGSGESLVTQFDSTVFYHQNSPTWGELMKLELPAEVMQHCHVFFSFRHRSSKEDRRLGVGQSVSSSEASSPNRPFAHAYLPLFEANRAFIQDGSHSLVLWRSSRPAQNLSPELYFTIPATVPHNSSVTDIIPPSLTSVIQPLRDVLTIRTFLVSTKYTQNEVLLNLLNWDTALADEFEELKSVLVKFTFVSEVEIVKFLRDIFDALFGIMVSARNSDGELDDLVFAALVTVLGIVQDRRFTNFRATLDVYLERHFHSPSAYIRMLASMSRLLQDPTRAETSQSLRASIKVWPYLFRMIVRSRQNQRSQKDQPTGPLSSSAVSDHLETRFKRDLEQVLRSINKLMASTKPSSIIGTQTLALQHFAGIIPDLACVFSVEEVVRMVSSFADSVFITKGRMVVWKLLHIYHVASGPLFDDHTGRSQLIPSIVRWIRPHLGRYEEANHTSPKDQEAARDAARIAWIEGARLAVTILAIMLDRLQVSLVQGRKDPKVSSAQQRQEQDNVDYIMSMMPRLLETYKELNSEDAIRTLERSRTPSTIAASVPVIFPSAYPFPLIAKHSPGRAMQTTYGSLSSRRAKRKDRLEFLHCGLGEIAAVLTVLIMLSPRKHLASFLEEQLDLEGSEKTAKFLQDFFDVSTSILLNEAYPSTWLNVNILAHQMVLKMADPLAALLVREYIPKPDASESFNAAIWGTGLNMLLTLLSSEQLVIEQFKPQRRRAVWRLAGDIRGEGAQIFVKLWNSIGWPDQSVEATGGGHGGEAFGSDKLNTGGFQVQFVPTLVEPVLELCLSHHDELRTCAVRVLATMITSEWHLNGDFTVIEAEIIDKLDILFVTDTKGDEISRAFFIGQLRSLFESPSVEPKLQEQVHSCLVSVNRFLDLLLNVRSLPLEEGFEDDRIAGTLKLLGFLRQANRVSAFSTHVLRLVNLHLENQNYVEAALTLKLHADLHTWDLNTFVEPIQDLDLPRQSHFARKETLYMLILDYLGKGQAWEISVDICRELAQQYEYRSVDYLRLADVLAHQATLYQKIATSERAYPAYFRVAYYGEQWPSSLQGKMFVYRGLDWEKFNAFCDRLQQKHPKAVLIKSTPEPSAEIRFGDAQYLQLTALQPEPDRSKEVFTNPEVPPIVRAYFEHNTTNLFSFTRPLPKSDPGANEKTALSTPADGRAAFEDLWVEKTYLRCEDAFPTVLRRSEVAEIEVVEVSPLENALSDVEAKQDELETLEKKYKALAKVETVGQINTTRLSMALNGAVDAPVNGGIPMYKRAFFAPQFLAVNAGKQDLIDKLRDAIDAQAAVVFRCIKLHALLCPSEMRPFHETLIRFFRQNFAEEINRQDLDTAELEVPSDTDGSIEDKGSLEGPRRADPQVFSSSAGNDNGWTPYVGGSSSTDQNTHAYSLDANSRLQKLPVDVGGASAQSPLQRHISYLTKRSQGVTSTRTSLSDVVRPSPFDSVVVPVSSSRAADSGIGSAPVQPEPLSSGAANGSSGGGHYEAKSPPSTLGRHTGAPSVRYDGASTIDGTSTRQSLFSKATEGGSRLSRFMSSKSRR